MNATKNKLPLSASADAASNLPPAEPPGFPGIDSAWFGRRAGVWARMSPPWRGWRCRTGQSPDRVQHGELGGRYTCYRFELNWGDQHKKTVAMRMRRLGGPSAVKSPLPVPRGRGLGGACGAGIAQSGAGRSSRCVPHHHGLEPMDTGAASDPRRSMSASGWVFRASMGVWGRWSQRRPPSCAAARVCGLTWRTIPKEHGGNHGQD